MRGQTVNQPLYDVFDIDENKVIITGADSQTISERSGIKKYKVSEYELYKRQFQRRYVIFMQWFKYLGIYSIWDNC
jgi:hypothetical protein